MNTISTKTLSTAEWRALRTDYIGGSDVAAVLGKSEYKSPFMVWLEKTGQLNNPGDTSIIRFGNLFEPIARQEFSRIMNVNVELPSSMIIHPVYPMLAGNVDGVIHSTLHDGKGILEVKTTSTHRVSPWDLPASIPTEWTYQVQHYLGVTGFGYAYLQIFFRDTCEFAEPIYIPRDDELIASNNQLLSDWWASHVEIQTPPPMKTNQDLILRHPGSNGVYREASSLITRKYRLLLSLRERLNGLTALKESVEFDLKDYCGEAEGIAVDGQPVVSWRPIERNSMDMPAFRKDHPDLYKSYLKTTQTRTFKLK